jgi:2',3'-cyclic-nucleotide 2'-phosphodiesterase (5'-nucleotidase family)
VSGPALAVDAGDSLVHAATFPEPQRAGVEARARLVLSAMARARLVGVAVGERDLALGATWLAREARSAGVPLLAANLRAADGTQPFEGHRIVEAVGERIGVFAILGSSCAPAGMTVLEPAAAARAAAAAARAQGATMVVALLHMEAQEAVELLKGGLPADLAVRAHDGKRSLPESVGSVLLAASSDRGRDVLAIVLRQETRGQWADEEAPARAEEERRAIERWMDTARSRLSRATAEADRRAIQDFLAFQTERAADAARRAKARPEGRLYAPRSIPLGPELPEDAELAAEVERVTAAFGPPPGQED